MSIKLVDLAFDSTLPPTFKLVLAAFADTANEYGECFPSMEFVARRASVSKRTAQRVTQILISEGYIESIPRFREDRSQSSNKYKIYIPAKTTCDILTPPHAHHEDAGVSVVAAGDDTIVTLTTTEPSSNQSNHNHLPSELIFPAHFSTLEKSNSQKLISTFSPELAQQLLDEVAARMRRNEIIKSPISYLRGLATRAKNGNFIPELADSEVQIRTQRLAEHVKPQPNITAAPEARNRLNELKKLIK